jgi:hypothetical protein
MIAAFGALLIACGGDDGGGGDNAGATSAAADRTPGAGGDEGEHPLPGGCESIDITPVEAAYEDATGIRPELELTHIDDESTIIPSCRFDNRGGDSSELLADVLVTITSTIFADDLFPLDDEFEEVTIAGRDGGYLGGFAQTIASSGRGFEVEVDADRYTDAGPLEADELRDLTLAITEYFAETY